ncbi:MAG: hypothetical protein MJ105_09105 [Lachnospiraceae bacterium]|nr:hypothetical protein [Lachnospiraceae bacterium]
METTAQKEIVMIGCAANGSAQELAATYCEKLQSRFSLSYIRRMQKWEDPKEPSLVDENHVSLERQGVFQGLWELGEKHGTGMLVSLKAIPIRQEFIELANVLDVNPYELPSKGGVLLAAEHGHQLVEKLQEEGYEATVIGRFDKAKARLIVNGEEKRFLTPTR